MPATDPSPQTTLVILLGASKWPYAPNFTSSPAFANAAEKLKTYCLDLHFFGLPPENLLNLFNCEDSPDDIDRAIGTFFDQRLSAMKSAGSPARDLLFYFVGHGGFAGNDLNFYLAIQRTREGSLRASSIQMDALADLFKEKARNLRRFLILDCCFAAAAMGAFQSNPTQLAIEKTSKAFAVEKQKAGFPQKGTTLLCSSDHKTPSMLALDESSTRFSQALLNVLSTGISSPKPFLTFHEIKNLVVDTLQETPGYTPRPVLLSPDQSEGDVAEVPFFPNIGKIEDISASTSQPIPIISSIPHSKRRFVPVSITIFTILVLITFVSSHWYNPITSPQSTSSVNNTQEAVTLTLSTIQSKFWVLSGSPQQYSLSHLPETQISALYTDGHTSDPLYSLFFELHFLGKKHAGVVIDTVKLMIQDIHSIPHPAPIWYPGLTSAPTYYAPHVYEALYVGRASSTAISINHDYIPIHNDVFLLPSGETDNMELHVISRIEGDIVFTVQITYHFYGEQPSTQMLTIPGRFEVMFIDPSHWQQYHLQDGKIIAST